MYMTISVIQYSVKIYIYFLRVDLGAGQTKHSQNIYNQSRNRPNAINTQSTLFMWLSLCCEQNSVANPCVWKYLIFMSDSSRKRTTNLKTTSEIDSVFKLFVRFWKRCLNNDMCGSYSNASKTFSILQNPRIPRTPNARCHYVGCLGKYTR